MISSTKSELYLTAVRSLERIEIQFVPKQIETTRGAKYAEVEIVGRNNPLNAYLGGSNEMSMELDFYADDANREEAIRRCKWLEALASSDGFEAGPDEIRITFGKMFVNDIWVLKSVKCRYSHFQPEHNWLPQQAYAAIVLMKNPKKNLRQTDIKWN